MKKIFENAWTAFTVWEKDVVKSYFGSVTSTSLSILAVILGFGILYVATEITNEGFQMVLSRVWSAYADFVGQYVALSPKELAALALAILTIVGDCMRQPITWLIFCLTHKPDPQKFQAEAKRVSSLPFGTNTTFVIKVIIASAIFWYFAK